MGKVVNRTWEAAAEWQKHAVWIRMNVGYIKAEVPYLHGNGEDVADIERLVGELEPVFTMFCENEMAVFVAARRVEAELISRDDFVATIRALENCFQPWLENYHAAVQARRAADDHSLGENLLLGCGSELLNAQRALAGAIDAYANGVA